MKCPERDPYKYSELRFDQGQKQLNGDWNSLSNKLYQN